jgi:hypothetical protein
MQALLSMFSLAAGFSHTRDWRDAFEDIMEQVDIRAWFLKTHHRAHTFVAC